MKLEVQEWLNQGKMIANLKVLNKVKVKVSLYQFIYSSRVNEKLLSY